MDAERTLPAVVVAVVAVVAVLSGPVGPLDLTADPTPCDGTVFPGDGNATVSVISVPERATLSESDFGAAVWRLAVPPATVNVSDIDGRPTLSYRLSVPALGRTVGTTTVLSRCTRGEVSLAPDRSTFEPDRIDGERDRYNGTLYLVYRGYDNGNRVERTLAERNVTVAVVR